VAIRQPPANIRKSKRYERQNHHRNTGRNRGSNRCQGTRTFPDSTGSFGPGRVPRGTLNQNQVGQLLGPTRMEAEDFLAKHADLYDFDPGELRREAEFLAKLPNPNQPQ